MANKPNSTEPTATAAPTAQPTASAAVPELTSAQRQALFAQMQKEARLTAETKAAAKAGVTVEELREQRQHKQREARFERMAKDEGISIEEVRARVGTRKPSDGERKTLVSVSIPVSLPVDKQLERIERSITSLQAARQAIYSANPELAPATDEAATA